MEMGKCKLCPENMGHPVWDEDCWKMRKLWAGIQTIGDLLAPAWGLMAVMLRSTKVIGVTNSQGCAGTELT